MNIAVIEAGKSRRKILTLTPPGAAIIEEKGGTVVRVGPGSIEHEYWRARVRTICEQQGYTVTAEYGLGHERYADLQAQRDARTLH